MKAYGELLKDVRENRIMAAVDIAARLYQQYGIDSVKMTDIAEASGLGVASLYRYFGTKQAFTIRVAEHLWQQKLMTFASLYSGPEFEAKCGLDQVRSLIEVFARLYENHRRFLRFLAAFDAYVRREKLAPKELHDYNAILLEVMQMMTSAIEKGQRDGSIRSDFCARTYYFSVAHSLMSLCQRLSSVEPADSATLDANRNEILLTIDIFINYIRA